MYAAITVTDVPITLLLQWMPDNRSVVSSAKSEAQAEKLADNTPRT
jgi:hypothetical protein